MTIALSQKASGAYYTPVSVADALVAWAVREPGDRLLDPSCGDGRFLALHQSVVGVEQDARAAEAAARHAPHALVHHGDFFQWAAETPERFDCLAGNPPFIRYQRFSREVRGRALALCERLGAKFSGLTSSWAPFLVAAASLLKRGRRMAFVVPAEIGHAPYAAPFLDYLVEHFSVVQVVAVRRKLFPDLSEDCWLLYAEGFGGAAREIRFSAVETFVPDRRPPAAFTSIPLAEWRGRWQRRLRPFLLTGAERDAYASVVEARGTKRLGDLAQVGIGYVSGANDFFHLSPSEAGRWDIPAQFLAPSVRKGSALPAGSLTDDVVADWHRRDDSYLLLRLRRGDELPTSVKRYLDSEGGYEARAAYKCRVRDPWYAVPDVHVPDYFLSYMSGAQPALVRNEAGATCINSIHAVRLKPGASTEPLAAWGSPFVQLSSELEGHPLGGGMLKLEPREAARIVLPDAATLKAVDAGTVQSALATMRAWRHLARAS